MTRRTRALGPLLAITTMGMLAACGSSHSDSGSDKATAASTKNKTGVLEIAAGDCGAAAPAGSWFRMVQPGGSPQRGPYVENGDSPCTDKAVTPLLPGADRGLRIGTYQPQPNPAFGADGGSLSQAVIKPVIFFAVPFGISSNPTDPQTGRKVPAPTVTIAGSTLRADLSALSVSWNGQHFNQGAPKPGSSGDATGTFDTASNHYTLDWTSAISGGPFNGFTGVWHLEGTYRS